MPKYFYTMVAFCLVLWVSLVYFMTELIPGLFINKITIVLLLFVCISLTAGLIGFVISMRQAQVLTNNRQIYANSVKLGFHVGFLATGILSMKIFNVLTGVNLLLFFILCYLLLNIQRRRKA